MTQFTEVANGITIETDTYSLPDISLVMAEEVDKYP